MNYLFLLTISPVQSFISQARKTCDLYHSSKLLSVLIKEALDQFNLEEKIFPIIADINAPSCPNRFIAKITKQNTAELKAFAENLKTGIINRLKRIAEILFKDKVKQAPELFMSAYNEQISNFLDIQWAAVPLKQDYHEAFANLTALINAVKNTRTFTQSPQTDRKCSLCGERTMLFYNAECSNPSRYHYGKAIKITGWERKLELDKSEGLCAVCFTKRFDPDQSFPSTACIATMDWVDQIGESAVADYKELFGGSDNFNDQFYYRENLKSEYLEKYDYDSNQIKLREADDQLTRFYKDYIKPSKYYALVMFDGDNMGQWLSGKFLANIDQLEAFHKALSRALAQFACTAGKTLKTPRGHTVYAGGDDFMGFVNLAGLFAALEQWYTSFDECVNTPLKSIFQINTKLTFSAGVVIAHYKTPLQEVIKTARQREQAAKSMEDKAGIGFAFITKSNNIYTCSMKYEKINLLKELVRTLMEKKLTKNVKDILTSAFIHNFSNTFRSFRTRCHAAEYATKAEMFMTELKRLMLRSTENKSKEKEWKHKGLYESIKTYFYSINSYDRGFHIIQLPAFIDFLELAAKLAEEMRNVH